MVDIVRKISYIPGARLFKEYLEKKYEMIVCREKISSIMKDMHLVANMPCKDSYKGKATHYHITIAKNNHVNQDFLIGPRKVILTDITYLFYGINRTVCYLCCFKDAFTNEILGHSISTNMTVDLVKEAYDMMMLNHMDELRKPECYIHSDQGSQYLSTSFQNILSNDKFIQSTSQRGNSLDNSPMESFFGRFKTELNNIIALCPNVKIVRELINGYMDLYNNERIQLSLSGLSPSKFYSYITSGVYPLDSYFGINSNKLLPVNDLVKARKALTKRTINRSKKSKVSKIDPLSVLNKDKIVVVKIINKLCKEKDEYLEKINHFENILSKIDLAISFLKCSSKDVIEDLKDISNWKKYDFLNYTKELGPLY